MLDQLDQLDHFSGHGAFEAVLREAVMKVCESFAERRSEVTDGRRPRGN